MGALRLIAGAVTLAVLVGVVGISGASWIFVQDMAGNLRRLAAAAGSRGIAVTEAMVAMLPAPAQCYFRHAGIVGRPIPAIVVTQCVAGGRCTVCMDE